MEEEYYTSQMGKNLRGFLKVTLYQDQAYSIA